MIPQTLSLIPSLRWPRAVAAIDTLHQILRLLGDDPVRTRSGQGEEAAYGLMQQHFCVMLIGFHRHPSRLMWEKPREPQWFSHLPDQKAEHCEGKKQLSARASTSASAGTRSPLARGAASAVVARVAMKRVSFMVKVGGC